MVRGASDHADLGLNDLVQGLGQKRAKEILANVLLDEGQQGPGDGVRIRWTSMVSISGCQQFEPALIGSETVPERAAQRTASTPTRRRGFTPLFGTILSPFRG